MTWLGLDIGGANLKAADSRGWARSIPFALWRDPSGLAGALTTLLADAPDAARIAVTMTGELCDCFRTKAEGVRHILAALVEAARDRVVRVYVVGRSGATAGLPEGVREFHSVGNALRGVPKSKPAVTKIERNGTEAVPYNAVAVSECPDALGLSSSANGPSAAQSSNGGFESIEEAFALPHLAAASNWHALARFACRYLDGAAGVLVDIGSTTTDIVPLVEGMPRPQGHDDITRLLADELVYTGVGRTPICAIAQRLPWRGHECPVAAELFATTADAYVLLGILPEQSGADVWTADGRPLTKEFARERLARMICADATQFDPDDALKAAAAVRDCQLGPLCESLRTVVSAMEQKPIRFVLSGRGEPVGRKVIEKFAADAEVVSLSAELGSEVSACAAAYAVAMLAWEATGGE